MWRPGCVVLGGWLAVFGCAGDPSTSSSSDAGSDASPLQALRESACRDWSGRLCAGLEKCSPASFTASFPSVEACIDRKATQCLIVRFAPGMDLAETLDPRPCLEGYDFSTCSAVLRVITGSEPFPPACPHGAGVDGTPCWYAEGCEGQVCFNADGSGCGKCGHLVAEGQPCTSWACAYGTYCDGKCKPRGESGAACAETSHCQGDLACVAGKCAARLPAGASCGGDDRDPCAHGTACNPLDDTCVSITTAGLGEPCGIVDADTIANCSPEAHCKGGFTAESPGICVARKQDGEACTPPEACLEPAFCFKGKCQIIAGNACGYPAP